MEKKLDFSNIDEYIALAEEENRKALSELRQIIKNAAPKASEKISWAMPTFYLNGNLMHFALAKKHIGLYPGAEAVEAFEKELQGYKTSKGAIQLPLDKPLPTALIEKIVLFNVERNSK